MSALTLLVPLALGMGFLGLACFAWTLRSGQYDDPEGAASRILFDDIEEKDRCDPKPSR